MHCNAWMMCHLVVWSTYNQEFAFAETLGIWFHEKFRYLCLQSMSPVMEKG